MKLIQGGKNIILLVLVLAISLGFTWTAVNGGADRWFNPTPEKIAEEFISSLAAHRYTGARNTLSADLRDKTTSERLQVLVSSIEARTEGIEQVLGEASQQYGDTALATVHLTMRNGSEQRIQIPLIREHGLWKISGLEDLWSLIFIRMPFKLFTS